MLQKRNFVIFRLAEVLGNSSNLKLTQKIVLVVAFSCEIVLEMLPFLRLPSEEISKNKETNTF